ncbi:MAG: hypothetical protein JXA22_00155 [Candidatus Thermoplasmatota archaeon]|nr:hypothetical protein [Candidatus Thermoplasmatota archaeon]
MFKINSEPVRIGSYKLGSEIRYRYSREKRYNTFYVDIPDVNKWERDKVKRLKARLTQEDRRNVEKITDLLIDFCRESGWYEMTLIVHGSTTFGKKNYKDIDMFLEPSSMDLKMYDKLIKRLRKDLNLRVLKRFVLQKGIITKVDILTLKSKDGCGSPIQITLKRFTNSRGTFFLKGKELIETYKDRKIPYIALIIDNEKIG